jgi:integrase
MSPRKLIDSIGRPRSRAFVRVFREEVRGASLIRVQWNEPKRTTSSFPDTRQGIAEAKAFARGLYDRLVSAKGGPQFDPLTMREMWLKYLNRNESAWRAKTKITAQFRWQKWERFIGDRTSAAGIKRDKLDEFKTAMLKKHSPNQVLAHLGLVTAVYRWAVDDDLIPPTKVATYRPKFSKEQLAQSEKMAEYSREERDRLVSVLDPRNVKEWRAWALTVLFAFCGPRQNAARNLEWRDIDLETNTIHWRPELDKRGNGRLQPMPAPVVDAFWVCYGWRFLAKYEGPFVFFGAQDRTSGKPFTYQALHQALARAEARAGIAHVKYRATHGHRRGVAGDLHAATGSSKTAANWIGDKSVEVVEEHYLLERDSELRKSARMLETPNSPQSEIHEMQSIATKPEGEA